MAPTDLDQMSRLSPFELRNELVRRASRAAQPVLNAGRANPNFLATVPRQAFFELGLFAVSEAERTAPSLADGIGGLPQAERIIARFERFAQTRGPAPGVAFLADALSFAGCQLGFDQADFLVELVQGVLGCRYPEPVRMLPYAGAIIRHFLQKEIAGRHPIAGAIELFAVEGATAGITYVFNALRQNRLLLPGDKIALGMPIFTPYIDIPQLDEYGLVEIAINADPDRGWQYPERELDKLLDPQIKTFLAVNPGNPASVKIDQPGIRRISDIVATKRHDLIILTDDVYANLADDFVSLFATCPHNTILLYSFSKYFGATGWRLGVVAMHQSNVIDAKIAALPAQDRAMLAARYRSVALDPHQLKFIDRLVADSRSVALNHTAGLSTPQQVQMALFALSVLLDQHDSYKQAATRMIRQRYETFYRELGCDPPDDPNRVGFYAILDFGLLAARCYGFDFADWLLRRKDPLDFLFRLADKGVVLLPGKGFGAPAQSARVSLANLNPADYARLGHLVRTTIEEYADEYQKQDDLPDRASD